MVMILCCKDLMTHIVEYYLRCVDDRSVYLSYYDAPLMSVTIFFFLVPKMSCAVKGLLLWAHS